MQWTLWRRHFGVWGASCAAIIPLAHLRRKVRWLHRLRHHNPFHGLDSLIGRVYANDGWILLLGVDHDANTSIHLAENMCNAPYRIVDRVQVQENGQIHWVSYAEVNHCCRNFTKIAPHLTARDQLIVGQVKAQLMRSRHVVEVASDLMAQNPYYFLYPPGECLYEDEYDEARAYEQPTL